MDVKIGNQVQSGIISEVTSLLNEGEFGAMLDYTVTDKSGRIISQVTKKAESYVQQFLQLLVTVMCPVILGGSTPISVKDTSNVSKNPVIYIYGNAFYVLAAASDTTFGIIVGSGVTPVTITDHAIQTIIAHGVAAGQLQYGGVTFGAPSANTTTSQLTITRNFANNSGASITVNEIALYCQFYDDTKNTSLFMIIRDVISGGIIVANGQTLTVNYRPQAVI